jgi:hypothetical protein
LVTGTALRKGRNAGRPAGSRAKETLVSPDRISQRFAHESSKAVYADTDALLADVS